MHVSALFRMPAASGIEVLALDRGRGMSNVDACLARRLFRARERGGNGLGAVIRQSHFVDIASWPGLGTAVLARTPARHAGRRARRATSRIPAGVLCPIAMPGEDGVRRFLRCSPLTVRPRCSSRDGLGPRPGGCRGLGRGGAPVSSLQRVTTFRHCSIMSMAACASTRGAAVSIARFDPAARQV